MTKCKHKFTSYSESSGARITLSPLGLSVACERGKAPTPRFDLQGFPIFFPERANYTRQIVACNATAGSLFVL